MDGLWTVSTDTLLLFRFLLGLLEDELRYMAVEVFICDCDTSSILPRARQLEE